MSYNIMESIVRQRLREKNGQVYWADCLAKDLEQDPSGVRAAMDVLAPARTSRRDLARVASQDSCFAGRARRGSLQGRSKWLYGNALPCQLALPGA